VTGSVATGSVLVTGATGFIGRHLCVRLARAGWDVTALQRSESDVDGVRTRIVVPQMSADAVSRALEGRRFDRLFHLAAYGVHPDDRDVSTMMQVNVCLAQRLVAEAATWPVRAVVMAGSGAEYDLRGVDGPVSEDHPLEAFKLYGATKAAGTLASAATARSLGAPLAVARLFGVFGSGEAPHRLLPSLVRDLSAGRRVPLSDGAQVRDVLSVSAVVDALMRLADTLEADQGQHIVNLSSGHPATVRAFAEMTADAIGARRALLGFGDIPRRPDEVACFAGDPARLLALTDWRPYEHLSTAIEEAVAAMQSPSSRTGTP
tara:strand:+ start:1327 stop:2283 length:957 start_codon:yes stop_codon:yes gene_type:complete